MVTRTLLVLTAAAALVLGYSSGPPNGVSGRPGEGTCLNCHSGSSGSPDSSQLLGFPLSGYDPDSLHRLTLTVSYAGQRRWGFLLTVVDAANSPCGQLAVLDSTNTQYSSGVGGFGYLKQTSAGSFPGRAGSASWQLGWRAPARGAGPVTFYWCVNAANNNGGSSGDTIIRDSLTVAEATGIESDPARPRCTWHYSSPGRNRVVIDYCGEPQRPVPIWSASGRLVRTLRPSVTGTGLRLVWDGRDHAGALVPEAAYFIRLGDGVSAVLKVQLIH